MKASAFLMCVGGKTVLNSLAVEHLGAQNGGIVLHSSFVEYNKKGILFTAPSDTGKSTRTNLWHKHRGAGIINGDRSAICATEGGIVSYGTPFAGSSNICLKKILPLAAVVCLKQAPQNHIRRLVGARRSAAFGKAAASIPGIKPMLRRYPQRCSKSYAQYLSLNWPAHLMK